MLRLIIFTLLFGFAFSLGFAQDTTKKKPAVKTYPKYKAHIYYKHGYYHPKGDSAIIKGDSAQRAAAPADKSLNGQYQYLLSKVYHYQQPLISALWKNASDTLNANRAKLNASIKKIDAQNKNIDSLKTELSSQDQELARKDGVDLFGLVLPKTTYNLIVWGLVILLAIVAVVVIGRSAGYRREARYRMQLYTEQEEEFKTFKAKANDKEKKLARELQTERNKLDELLGRG